MYSKLPKSISITECTLREGFQAEDRFIPTAAKLYLTDLLADAGFKQIGASSFRAPTQMSLPQFRDVNEYFQKLKRRPGVEYRAGALTKGALDMGVQAKKEGHGPDMLELIMTTNNDYNKARWGMTVAENWKLVEYGVKVTAEVGIKFGVFVHPIWAMPSRPRTDPMYATVDRLVKMGCNCIGYGDPRSQATPPMVYEHLGKMVSLYPKVEHFFHCHEWRGFGLANYMAAIQAGVTHLETNMGGMGGGLSGWVVDVEDVPAGGLMKYDKPSLRTGLPSTEDLVVMCDAMGIETGVDVEKCLEIGRWMERVIGRRLWSASLPWGRIKYSKMYP